MKKKIVALVSAVTLSLAMCMNVCAAGSPTAEGISSAAGESSVVNVNKESNTVEIASTSGSKAQIDLGKVSQDAVDSAATSTQEATFVVPNDTQVVDIAKMVAVVLDNPQTYGKDGKSATEVIGNVFPVVITPEVKGATITVEFDLAAMGITAPEADQQIWAIDAAENHIVVGVVENGKVKFTSDKFSPYAIVKVKVAATPAAPASQPSNNNPSSPAVTVTAVAPKTGDMVVMVSVMAVIFMAGAAVAVFMSKKRA
ncbi:MAG: hypothetical protein NC543_06755 [bacterium]|nr:hypothetical protein [bacterium]